MIENNENNKTAQDRRSISIANFTSFSRRSPMISIDRSLDRIKFGNFVPLDKLGTLKFSTKCEIWENFVEVIYGRSCKQSRTRSMHLY